MHLLCIGQISSPGAGYGKRPFLSRRYLVWNSAFSGPLAKWVECSPMASETGVQSQVES